MVRLVVEMIFAFFFAEVEDEVDADEVDDEDDKIFVLLIGG